MAHPYRGSGAAHVVVGCICVSAGIAFGVLLGVYKINAKWTLPSKYLGRLTLDLPMVFTEVFQVTNQEWVSFLACSKIWCGFWFILTGAVGVNVQRKGCAESAYQFLSILNVVLWAPGVMVLNAILAYDAIVTSSPQAIIFPMQLHENIYWLLVFPAVGMFFGLIEFILSVVSSSVVCCCSRTSLPMTHLGASSYRYEMKYSM